MPVELAGPRASRDIPQQNDAVVAAGGQCGAVGTPRQAIDAGRVLAEHCDRLAGVGIPETYLALGAGIISPAIGASGYRQRRAVGAEAYHLRRAGGKRLAARRPRGKIPQPHLAAPAAGCLL